MTIGEDGVRESDVAVHDETNRALAGMLAAMGPPDGPVALGVLYCDPVPSFERSVAAQIEEAKSGAPGSDLNALLRQGQTWDVEV